MKSPEKNHKTSCKVILADDHPIVREGMKRVINKSEGLKVIAEVADGETLLEVLKNTTCDIVALDISMPGPDGIEILQLIKTTYPLLKVLIVSMHNEKEYFRMALLKGADGYVLKDDGIEKIVTALHDIYDGKRFFSSELIPYFVDEHTALQAGIKILQKLTRRESEILKLIVAGQTSKEVAEKLGLSKRTVDNHRYHIMEKLDVKNVAELIRVSFLKGLI